MKVTYEQLVKNYNNGFATVTKKPAGFYCYSIMKDEVLFFGCATTEEVAIERCLSDEVSTDDSYNAEIIVKLIPLSRIIELPETKWEEGMRIRTLDGKTYTVEGVMGGTGLLVGRGISVLKNDVIEVLPQEDTLTEINGKKYRTTEVIERISQLEPVEE